MTPYGSKVSQGNFGHGIFSGHFVEKGFSIVKATFSAKTIYGAVQIEATLSYNISVGKIETLRPLCVSAKLSDWKYPVTKITRTYDQLQRMTP